MNEKTNGVRGWGYIIREAKNGRYYLAKHIDGVRCTNFQIIKAEDAAPELYRNPIVEWWDGFKYVRAPFKCRR